MRWVALVVVLAGCESIFPLVGPGGPIADTGNEDSDPKNNSVDNCPGVTNDQADGDGDGVGDACDPHPELGDDSIVSGEFFNGSTSSWSFLGASWELDGAGGIQTTGPADDVDAVLTANASVHAPTIELGLTAVDYGQVQSPVANELHAVFTVEGTTVDCVYQGGMGPLTSLVITVNSEIGSAEVIELSPGAVHLLRLSLDGDRATCTVDGKVSTFTGPFPVPAAPRPTALSLRIKGTELLVSHIVVYDFASLP